MTITEQPPIPPHDGQLVQPGRSSSTHPYVLTWKADHAPVYPSVEAWVAEWLAPTLERDIKIKRTFQWCPQWWDHPEAVERLAALWEAWEFGRMEGGPWKGRWWTGHGDRQLPILCDPNDGPFSRCHEEHHPSTTPLATTPAPPNWELRPQAPSAAPATSGADDAEEDGNG